VKEGAADDWPMFGRDGSRNPVSPESDPPVQWDLGPDWGQKNWDRKQATNLKWAAELGSITCVDLGGRRIIKKVGTNNHTYDDKIDASVLVCFRENDGKLLYKYVSPRMNHRMLDWPYSSMANSPLVKGDRLWFATNRWEAVCLDIGPLKRGKGPPQVLWKRDLIKELGVQPNGAVMNYTRFSSFADYKDRLFLITGNGVDLAGGVRVPAPEAPSPACFEKKTGKVLWMDNSPGNNILSGQWASPLVVEIRGRPQVIAPQGDGWLRAFDGQTGELIWVFDMNRKESKWVHGGRGQRNNLLATPVFYENRIYLASGQQPNNDDGPGRLCCIDPTRTGDISSELAVDAARKRLPQRRLQAVNPKNGERAIPNRNSGLVWEYTKTDQNSDGEIDLEPLHRRSHGTAALGA
jgi:outer membrane protein assembly factor BamB